MEFNATFLVSTISFLVFVFLMNKIFYTPIENIIDEREALICDTLNAAKNANDEATELLKKHDDKLNEAIDCSKKIVADGIEKSNLQSKEMTDVAKSDSIDTINSKKLELNNQNEEIKSQLEGTIKDLATEVSAKILGYKKEITG